jgi:CRP/FNR family cyclic AMP-dependent transcriptional regulator
VVSNDDEQRSATTTTTVTTSRIGSGSQAAPTDRAAALARVSLFAGLNADDLRELAVAARRRTFQAGDAILHRDEPGHVLYVIRSGRVKICLTSPDGQEIVLALFGMGDYFGELALLDGQPRSASAIAIETTETLALQRADFLRAVQRYPRIAISIMQVLAQRLRQTDVLVEDLLFLDVHGRVAKKLLDLAETHGTRTAEGIRIEMRLTQGALAALVGASRESVNKVMGYFTDKQLVRTDKYHVTILRLEDLRRRAL